MSLDSKLIKLETKYKLKNTTKNIVIF